MSSGMGCEGLHLRGVAGSEGQCNLGGEEGGGDQVNAAWKAEEGREANEADS